MWWLIFERMLGMRDNTRIILGGAVLSLMNLLAWHWLARRIAAIVALVVVAGYATVAGARKNDPGGMLFAATWLTLASIVGYLLGAAGYLLGTVLGFPLKSTCVKSTLAQASLVAVFARELHRFHKVEKTF